MMKKQFGGVWRYVSGDLNLEMIKTTIESYNSHVIEYAEGFEWDPDMQVRTSQDYLHKFIQYLKLGDHIFVMGSGTGRDALELQNRRFKVFCVDASSEMLQVAVEHGIRLPMWCQDVVSVCMPTASIDGILAESVLQHVSKRKIKKLLKKMVSWLRVDGVLLARIRIGDGKTFVVDDIVGKRYFVSYRLEELEDLINSMEDVQLMEDVTVVDHKVKGRPGFGSFVIRKIK